MNALALEREGYPRTKLNLCIVSHLAYGALTGGSAGHIGGVERQTSLMAKWFAAQGHRVTMITWDEGQGDGVDVNGVRVVTVCGKKQGIPGVRFLHPRWTSLIGALKRADAAVYYQNCGEGVTGQVAAWCRINGRPLVFSTASDKDCMRRIPANATGRRGWRDHLLYAYGIRHSSRVIVQTRTQQRLMIEQFRRESTVLPMACPGPTDTQFSPPAPPDPRANGILWVGRSTPIKRPEGFLAVAQACPDLRFDLVGPWYDDAYSRAVRARAEHLPNVTVHGPVDRARMAEFYCRAACLCCTSESEGFPNTFLEAWSYGLPVVSTFDPDQLIADNALGGFAPDTATLIREVRSLLSDRKRWLSASANARRYYAAHYPVDQVMREYEHLFLEVGGAL